MQDVEILKPSEELDFIMEFLTKTAKSSSCVRSKCASVVVNMPNTIIGGGYNSKPLCGHIEATSYKKDLTCIKDELPADFKSDKTCCVHAEQRAIMDALQTHPNEVHGSTIFFLRLTEEGEPAIAGDPYCTICSKMALDVGIKYFVLLQKEGWTSYDTKYYNELSFKYKKP